MDLSLIVKLFFENQTRNLYKPRHWQRYGTVNKWRLCVAVPSTSTKRYECVSIQYIDGGWGLANRSNFECLNPAFSCTLAVVVVSNLLKWLLFHSAMHAPTKLKHSCFCVNILSTFVENGNINIRHELRKLSQQSNF